jgi:hypothetical protein
MAFAVVLFIAVAGMVEPACSAVAQTVSSTQYLGTGGAVSATVTAKSDPELLRKRLGRIRLDVMRIAASIKTEKDPKVRESLARQLMADKLESMEIRRQLALGREGACARKDGR